MNSEERNNFKIIETSSDVDLRAWDNFVESHPQSNLYQCAGWKKVIEQAYGHKSFYLMAAEKAYGIDPEGKILGLLPLIHMKHFFFGNRLVSIPFFDMGGMLTNFDEIERALAAHSLAIGKRLGVAQIEMRHNVPLHQIEDGREDVSTFDFHDQKHKVRMILDLLDSSENLMKSFKSKLRSQIKRPIKEGLHAKIGGLELFEDFYSVFCVNMRDLGSPVHSKKLFQMVMVHFKEKAKLVLVYKEKIPVAGSLIIGFKEIMENPWASSLREYNRFSPNMLLYWTMLEYACENGYRKFDFGRSTPGEGTYKFKKQWGAEPQQLHWHTFALDGKSVNIVGPAERSNLNFAMRYWQKLPVPLTKALGPMIRKQISL